MMTDKDSSAVDTDNRPPILEENDYESWRIRIERYIKGKPHGKLIWKSIQNGSTPHPQTTDPAPEGGKRRQRNKDKSTPSPLLVLTRRNQQHLGPLLMQAKEKGVVLDAEAEAFLADVECTTPYDQPLALTTTNLFEANHEDAYDSDVDEGPHASAAFMANLSSTSGINGSSSSHINEVQISDDSFFSDVSYPLAQEMQQEEHLNSEVDSVLDDNMITYDEYQNDSGVEDVPTVVSADEADKQSMMAVLQRMHTEIASYVRVNDEHKLVSATLTAKLERCKIKMKALERNKVKHDLDMAIVERNKRNAELEEENVMLKSTLKSKVVSIENLQQESKQVLSEKKTLEDKFTKKPVASLLKKPKVNVPLSTGIKSATGASKPT
nr:hypothetical protein [Tanacetum cinerariifolium]